MRGSERVDAKENASPLNRKEGQRLDLLHKSFLIPLQLELHIDFAVMDLVLVAEIVFVYQSYRILVLSGKLALSWRFLFLLHEVDAEEDGNFVPPRGNLSANNDDGDDGLDAW